MSTLDATVSMLEAMPEDARRWRFSVSGPLVFFG